MICYRDRSFCMAYALRLCVNHQCDRALTEAEEARARKWWGSDDAPVAFMDMSEGCERKIEPEDGA